MRTRLVSIPKLGKIETATWQQIKMRLNEVFKPTMSFESAQEKILAIQQKSGEYIEKYGDRVKAFLYAMNALATGDNA